MPKLRAIRPHEGRYLYAVYARVPAGGWICLRSHGIDACISSPSARQVHDLVIDVVIAEIERDGAGLLCQAQAFRHSIDGNDTFCAQQKGRLDRHLTDRAAAPDRDGIAWLYVAEVGGPIAGVENVG